MKKAVLGVLLALSVGAARQDGQSVAELRRMYDDAVGQLKQAQDRKNALAGENEKLSRQLAELQKRVGALEARNQDLERGAMGYAGETYRLRAVEAAWKAFMAANADVERRWRAYIGAGDGEGFPVGKS